MTVVVNTSTAPVTCSTSAQSTYLYNIVGYYTAWSIYDRAFFVTDIDVSKIDIINYAFANIVNGEIALGDPWADTQYPYPGDC